MKPKAPSPAISDIPLDAQAIDALYGLEPVFEPAVDCSAGAFRYIEDCHVCCQPIELAGGVGDDGALVGVTATRS